MGHFLVAIVAGLLLSSAVHAQQVVLAGLKFRSWEAKTFYMNVYESRWINMNSYPHVAEIKGVVSREEQSIDVSSQEFESVTALVEHVQNTYCKVEHVPAGKSVFHAGRNISVVLKDYVPQRLTITISMRVGDAAETRRHLLTCPNSMRSSDNNESCRAYPCTD